MVGVLGRGGFAVESAAARVCREAGGRVSVNVRVQDMDMAHPHDNRRLEIVVDGLPLYQGAQLAVDTTLVSVFRRDGVPRQQAATHDGAALFAARRRKERVFPELTGEMGRTRLVVLAGKWEVGGLRNPASSSTNWRKPWPGESLGICVRGRMGISLGLKRGESIALSLLERRSGLGSDGDTHSRLFPG